VLEAEALDGVVQFDVDTEVVGVQLEVVVVPQAGFRGDRHGEGGHGAVHSQLPVPVRGRFPAEGHGGLDGGSLVSHENILQLLG
jgi:hypothetical protein